MTRSRGPKQGKEKTAKEAPRAVPSYEGGRVTPTFEKKVADLVGKRAKLFRALAR